ncbi:MAG: hypothetical protein JWP32_2879 [Schumannella sp.]|nr:hypothetical protein [Schumannella sp.]
MAGAHMEFSDTFEESAHKATTPVTPAVFVAPDPIDAHDDDYAAGADGDWTPDPKDLA